MQYEVEMKFEMPAEERPRIRHELAARGISWEATLDQEDRYYGHPSRDFAETDEALRIRRSGSQAALTYKGPKIDAASKTRREIELELPDGRASAETLAALLEALGFVGFATVRKTRAPGSLAFEGRAVEVALDEVAGLGAFMELETPASEADVAEARQALERLAAALGLRRGTRRSYLEMLLDRAM